MTLTELTQADDRLFRRYEYDDAIVAVADLGLPDDAVEVEILDGAAVVVVEEGDVPSQHDVDLPEGDAQAFMKNGILTIEVRQ